MGTAGFEPAPSGIFKQDYIITKGSLLHSGAADSTKLYYAPFIKNNKTSNIKLSKKNLIIKPIQETNNNMQNNIIYLF